MDTAAPGAGVESTQQRGKTAEDNEGNGAKSVIGNTQEYAKAYGPFAFGVITLLILWYTIMKPELDKKTLDFEQHRKIIEEQSQQVRLLQMSADTPHNTATLLDSATKRLERIGGAN